MPELFIITGSNGAGKSSIGPKYLPQSIREKGPVFDGDKLFVEKRKELWRTIKSHKECAKLAYEFVTETFDRLVEAALTVNQDFAYEGHFTNEATWDIPRRFKEAGYGIHLIFLGLKDTSLSELRVVDRAQSGGHYVDPRTVTNNFYGNLEKLNQHYAIFQTIQVIDTSEAEHVVLTVIEKGMPTIAVEFDELPTWFHSSLPAIAQKIQNMSRHA
jgi:predicted ABC-type ATPase